MMENNLIINRLRQEEEKLKEIISYAKSHLVSAPEGSVQIRKRKNSYQYYHRNDSSVRNGSYIPSKDRQLAYDLVQKRYLEKVINAADKQLHAVESFLEKYNPDAVKNVFSGTSAVRQSIITPVELPDELFVERWQSEEYEHKRFADDVPEHYTQKNERVRSKSEVMIADALYHAGIPYHYEQPLYLNNRIIHPDFTVLRISDRKELYWEHLGMMDDEEYLNNAIARIRQYESAGFFQDDQLIITMETVRMPLNQAIIRRTISHYIEF